MTVILGYTPFLQPLDVHDQWWFLLLPMALFISMAYKGVRMRDLSARAYWRAVLVMCGQIVLALVALAIGLWVFVEHVVAWFQS